MVELCPVRTHAPKRQGGTWTEHWRLCCPMDQAAEGRPAQWHQARVVLSGVTLVGSRPGLRDPGG